MKKKFSVVFVMLFLAVSVNAYTVLATETENEELSPPQAEQNTPNSVNSDVVPGTVEDSPVSAPAVDTVNPVEIGIINTPVINAGDHLSLSIPFTAGPGYTIRAIDIGTSTDISVFPFRVAYSSYKQSFPDVSYALYQVELDSRGDAAQNYYTVHFIVTYSDGAAEYVCDIGMTVGILSSPTPAVSAPRIIISSVSTDPESIVAGDDFLLSVELRNTSRELEIGNLRVTFSSVSNVFTVTSDVSSVYIDRIPPSGSKSISVGMHAGADGTPGSYPINVSIEFEYVGETGAVVSKSVSETVSVAIISSPRLNFSKIQMAPQNVKVGHDVDLFLTIYNVGNTAVYNISAKVRDTSSVFSSADGYISSIAPKQSGDIDVYLTAVSTGKAEILIEITYEDEDGGIFYYTDTASYIVSERSETPAPIPQPEESVGVAFPFVAIISVLVVAGILVLILWRRWTVRKRFNKNLSHTEINDSERAAEDYYRNYDEKKQPPKDN